MQEVMLGVRRYEERKQSMAWHSLCDVFNTHPLTQYAICSLDPKQPLTVPSRLGGAKSRLDEMNKLGRRRLYTRFEVPCVYCGR